MPTGSFYDVQRLPHISAPQLSQSAGNNAILTGGGGLASAFKPRLRLRQGLPLMMDMVPVVGGSLGVNMTPT